MKTLVGAAEPSDIQPVVMIVDSTPEQRADWDEQCRLIGVKRHFVDVKGALRRMAEGFPIVGVILDRDRLSGSRITDDQLRFINGLKEAGYKGPLVAANFVGCKQLQTTLQKTAEGLGISLLVDDDQTTGYAEMLVWCLDH